MPQCSVRAGREKISCRGWVEFPSRPRMLVRHRILRELGATIVTIDEAASLPRIHSRVQPIHCCCTARGRWLMCDVLI